jgi:hypothetical protein
MLRKPTNDCSHQAVMCKIIGGPFIYQSAAEYTGLLIQKPLRLIYIKTVLKIKQRKHFIVALNVAFDFRVKFEIFT